MKRILSCFLMMALLLSICCVSYARQGQVEAVESQYRILSALKVMNKRNAGTYGDYADKLSEREHGDYSMFRTLSKSGFINFLCNILDEYGYTEEYSAEAIAFAEGLGLVHKNQDDLQKPLYYDEAITMVVRLLGYEEHAEKFGGFPTGYISIASRLGLTEGMAAKSGERLQEYDIITLLYNTINCAYVEIVGITEDGILYGNTSENAALYELRKIYRIDGIVEGTDLAALTAEMTVSGGRIMINGNVFRTAKDYSDMLGMNVEAYVQENSNGEDIVLAVEPYSNEEIIVDGRNVEGISADFRKFTYLDQNGKDRTVSVSPVVKVIYNGQYCKDYTQATFRPDDGEVRLLDNNSGSEYDVIFITDYKTVVVDYVATQSYNVRNAYTYDTTNASVNLEEQGDDVVKIVGDSGELSFHALEKGDVLSIVESVVDGRSIKNVYVSKKKITGTVSALHENEEIEVTVDGTEYSLSAAYRKALETNGAGVKKDARATQLRPGGTYVLYLDKNGKIAYAEETDSTIKYGIVMAIGDEGTFSKEYLAKIFTAEGFWNELRIADKIEYDGNKGIRTETIIGNIPQTKDGTVSVIAYKTGSDGRIAYIDIPESYSNGNQGAFNVTSGVKYKYRSANKSFKSEVFLKNQNTIWVVDSTDMGNELSYNLTTQASLQNDREYDFYAYDINEVGVAGLFLLLASGTNDAWDLKYSNLFVVESVEDTLTSDGEAVGNILGATVGYDAISYYCEDRTILDSLEKGDVISVKLDARGYVVKVDPYYSIADGLLCTAPSEMYSNGAVAQGIVDRIDMENLCVKIDCGADGFRTVRMPAGAMVVIYDKEFNQMRTGTIEEIEEDDFIVTKVRYSNAPMFVVYR